MSVTYNGDHAIPYPDEDTGKRTLRYVVAATGEYHEKELPDDEEEAQAVVSAIIDEHGDIWY